MSADIIRRMVEAGTPADIIADVAMALADAAASSRILEDRRAKDRERKRDIPRNSVEVAEPLEIHTAAPFPLDGPPKNISNPPLIPQTPKERGAAKDRGSRLAADFEMPIDWLRWAMTEKGWGRGDVRTEAANFHDFWIAKPGADGIKLDWLATWRRWCRNSNRPPGDGKARAGPATSIEATAPCL